MSERIFRSVYRTVIDASSSYTLYTVLSTVTTLYSNAVFLSSSHPMCSYRSAKAVSGHYPRSIRFIILPFWGIGSKTTVYNREMGIPSPRVTLPESRSLAFPAVVRAGRLFAILLTYWWSIQYTNTICLPPETRLGLGTWNSVEKA